MTTPDIAAVMAQAMDTEDRRRELASQSPGLGALMELPDVPYGPGVGVADVPLPVIGESHQAVPQVPQRKAYGPASPVYADPVVAGLGYAPGDVQTALRHVADLGADALLIEPRADGSNDAVQVISPQAAPRRSLWRRLLRRG